MNKTFLVLLVIAALLLSSCAQSPGGEQEQPSDIEQQEGITVAGSPSTPVSVELSMPFAPALGQEVTVSFKVSSIEDAPKTVARLILPSEVKVLSGKNEWNLDIPAGSSETVEAVISFDKAGQFSIEGSALYDLGGGTVWGDAAVIFLTIGEKDSNFDWDLSPGEEGVSAGEETGEDQAGMGTTSECLSDTDDCAVPQPQGIESECPLPNSEPATPISVALELDMDIALDTPVEVTFTVCSVMDAPLTKASLLLPEEAMVITENKNATWELDLKANSPVILTSTIQFTQNGEFMVSGNALYDFGDGTVWGDQMDVLVSVE
jgi:hypothetical protein